MTRGMVVIGAGECGARAALSLREQGYDGPVTMIGQEAHPPYERPPLSKGVITSAEPPLVTAIARPESWAAHGIEHIRGGVAAALDRSAKTVRLRDGRVLPYERLLLATGAVPRRLAFPTASPRVVCLRTFDDAVAIRGQLRPGCRVCIIGGGFVGLELAAAARWRGAEVAVIESQPRILMRGVPEDIAAAVHALHAGEGIDICCGEAVSGTEETPSALRIRLAGGLHFDADLVILGIGAVPVTDLAEAAGLTLANGIAVDVMLRTSDPDIYAAGDCCSFPLSLYGGRRVRLESWRNAQEQGALAASNMLGGERACDAVPWFWSDQFAMSLYVAGLCDEGRSIVRREVGDGAFILFHLASDGRIVAASGIGPGNAVARDIRLAEMLIARRAAPSPDHLAKSEVKLKTLLAA
jgi:3-phenylpropionate/trans-cinnamate dioxygenase ferredoxin reductase component